MVFSIDNHQRSESARPHAVHLLNGELHVFGRAARRDIQIALQRFDETLRAAQEWADRAPGKAVDLLDRARALLATEAAAPETMTAPAECTDRP